MIYIFKKSVDNFGFWSRMFLFTNVLFLIFAAHANVNVYCKKLTTDGVLSVAHLLLCSVYQLPYTSFISSKEPK